MTSYKDWSLRLKVLFAAVVPFVLCVVLTFPVIVNMSVKSIEERIKASVEEVASSTTLQVSSDVEYINSQVKLLALVIEDIKHSGNVSREAIAEILKDVAEKNKMVAGVWTMWEKNALDGNDLAYVNAPGNDENGRFSSFWVKDNGKLILKPLQYYNNTDKGNFYQLVKSAKHEIMINPYNSKISGKDTSITSIAYPITNSEGDFLGLVGIDIDMGYFQKIIENLSEYGVTASCIISDDNKYLVNLDRKMIGKEDRETLSWKNVKKYIEGGDSYIREEVDRITSKRIFKIISPIKLKSFDKNWALSLSMPLDKIKMEVYEKFIFIILIILVCIVLGVSVATVTARNITNPISSITNALERISLGNYQVEIPNVDSEDEIGQMSQSARIFRANARELLVAKQEAEASNIAKTEFLANMSHELRTPMHAMLSYSQLGMSKLADPNDKIYKYFSNISVSGSRLLNLLNNLLDLSKLEAGKMDFTFSKADILRCINQVKDELASLLHEKGITIDVSVQTKNTMLVIDFEKIVQVFINITSNAIKFSPNNSVVTITLSDSKVTYNGDEHPALLVAIQDQGIGIPEDELELIFDKFTQSSKTNKGSGGTGLGLSIAVSILKAHHGKIWAENAEGNGAVIKFLLPVSRTTGHDEVKTQSDEKYVAEIESPSS